MANLVSSIVTIGTSIEEVNVKDVKDIIPVDGTVYIWFGSFDGTESELVAQGAPVPDGAWLSSIFDQHDGVISMVSASGDVTVHVVE